MLARAVRAIGRRLRCWRALTGARRATMARLAATPPRRVLVICYGNIYRSPYVGEYLRRGGQGRIEVRTAGFHKKVGRPSPPEHVAMCAMRGISLDSHRSTRVEPAMLEWADTIVLMDRHNWLALSDAGADPSRLIWLGALEGGALEIPDPYGKSPQEAERIVERLTAASEVLLARLGGGVGA